MVDTLTDFPLQPLVDIYDCRYFAENDTGDCSTLNLALRSPFAKLLVLNRDQELVEQQRRRFQDNDRVQVFLWAHQTSWAEVVRLVPFEAPAVFWLHSTENVGRCLRRIAHLRPQRRDVIIMEPGVQRGLDSLVDRHFSQTHLYEKKRSEVLVVKPRTTG